jgi:hypothetical protein
MIASVNSLEIALLGISVTSVASPVQTLAVANVDGAGAAAASATATTTAGKAGKGAANAVSVTAAAATAKASAATKGGKNANRRDTLRWAKRIVDGEST